MPDVPCVLSSEGRPLSGAALLKDHCGPAKSFEEKARGLHRRAPVCIRRRARGGLRRDPTDIARAECVLQSARASREICCPLAGDSYALAGETRLRAAIGILETQEDRA